MELGYTPDTVRGMLKVLGQLCRWMDDERVKLGWLDLPTVDAFRAARPPAAIAEWRAPASCASWFTTCAKSA